MRGGPHKWISLGPRISYIRPCRQVTVFLLTIGVRVGGVKLQSFTVVLGSDKGVHCHHSPSCSISGVSKLYSAGQIGPTKPFHPAAKHILPI